MTSCRARSTERYTTALRRHWCLRRETATLANGGWGSFPEAVQLAAERGWKVEVWSWRACCSREFARLAAQYPASVRLMDFDTHAHEILYRASDRSAGPH